MKRQWFTILQHNLWQRKPWSFLHIKGARSSFLQSNLLFVYIQNSHTNTERNGWKKNLNACYNIIPVIIDGIENGDSLLKTRASGKAKLALWWNPYLKFSSIYLLPLLPSIALAKAQLWLGCSWKKEATLPHKDQMWRVIEPQLYRVSEHYCTKKRKILMQRMRSINTLFPPHTGSNYSKDSLYCRIDSSQRRCC